MASILPLSLQIFISDGNWLTKPGESGGGHQFGPFTNSSSESVEGASALGSSLRSNLRGVFLSG